MTFNQKFFSVVQYPKVDDCIPLNSNNRKTKFGLKSRSEDQKICVRRRKSVRFRVRRRESEPNLLFNLKIGKKSIENRLLILKRIFFSFSSFTLFYSFYTGDCILEAFCMLKNIILFSNESCTNFWCHFP